MELNWSTFVLEIINFLVLVWILKRFLYQPVLDVIARRQAGIEQTRAEAETLHHNAERLQQQYAGRLADWDRERQQARDALATELEAERTAQLTELETRLAQESEKAHVAELRHRADEQRRLEQAALAQGARFATRLLQATADPGLEAHLFELLVSELGRLPPGRVAQIRTQSGSMPANVEVGSAFPLPPAQRTRLEQALQPLIEPGLPIDFQPEPALLAGVRVTIGAWVLDANLQAELRGFAELAQDE